MNMLVMLGFSLVVGILVDDSIVVLENIYRHLAKGETPAEAALNGRSEIGLAAVTITLVDVVVFVPIAFMHGLSGNFPRVWNYRCRGDSLLFAGLVHAYADACVEVVSAGEAIEATGACSGSSTNSIIIWIRFTERRWPGRFVVDGRWSAWVRAAGGHTGRGAAISRVRICA